MSLLSVFRLEDSDLLECTYSDIETDSNDAVDGGTKAKPLKKKSLLSLGKGGISWAVYKLYIDSAGGPLAALLVGLSFALSIGSTAFSSWWLKHWFSRNGGSDTGNGTNSTTIEVINQDTPGFAFNRDVYAGIILIIFVTSIFRTLLFVFVRVEFVQIRMLSNVHVSRFSRRRSEPLKVFIPNSSPTFFVIDSNLLKKLELDKS